jgi:steroid delta-isomerase-like uncharacterized protein
MKTSPRMFLLAVITTILWPVVSQAADESPRPHSPVADLIYGLLPIVLIGGILWWFLRRSQRSPFMRRSMEYYERGEQHMLRMEQIGERIAATLGNMSTDAPLKVPRAANEAQNKSLARRLLEEVAATGAVDRLPEFLAPDCVAYHANIKGIDGFREHMLTFRHCYPDMVVTIDGQVAEGDIVVTWYTMQGTHLGAFRGMPPTKQRIKLQGVNVQRIENGRIVEWWGGGNSLEVLLELGLIRWAGNSDTSMLTHQSENPAGG